MRALLERLAVEEPEATASPRRSRARLVVNRSSRAARRAARSSCSTPATTGRSEVKRALDELRHAREVGDWAPREDGRAMQLVRWITEWTLA